MYCLTSSATNESLDPNESLISTKKATRENISILGETEVL